MIRKGRETRQKIPVREKGGVLKVRGVRERDSITFSIMETLTGSESEQEERDRRRKKEETKRRENSCYRINRRMSPEPGLLCVNERCMWVGPTYKSVCVCVHAHACAHAYTQPCPTLIWSPMDYSPPGSTDHGIFQARILEWVAISSSRGSSQIRH